MTSDAGHATTLRPYLRWGSCARQGCDEHGQRREINCETAAQPCPLASPPPVDLLLDALSRLFDSYLLGPDRAGKVALCLDIAARNTAIGRQDATSTALVSPSVIARVPDAEVDLASVPTPRLRRLLDAFAAEIHYDARQRRVRVAVRVSTLLYPFVTDTGLGMVVPARWPGLNPQAARALLRLLTHVADARDGGHHQRSNA